MKVAAIPLQIVHADVRANLCAAAERIHRVSADADVVVLPETFTTGYVDDIAILREVAETCDGPTLTDLHRWAEHFKVAIAGSYIATNAAHSRFWNRGFFIEPAGDETFYDKHHLFTQSGEDRLYTPGTKLPPVMRYMGWNISMAICYDLRFPEWVRNVRGAYDLLLLPAAWPLKRRTAWDALLRARAIENQAYVIGANIAGILPAASAPTPQEEYDTASTQIIDYVGRTLASGQTDMPVEAVIDLEPMRKLRAALPALRDQTPFAFTSLTPDGAM